MRRAARQSPNPSSTTGRKECVAALFHICFILHGPRALMRNRVMSAIYLLITLVVVGAVTALILMLPELPLFQGSIIFDMNPAADPTAYEQTAAQFRLALEDRYFEWAVVSITMCGAVVWHYGRAQLGLYVQLLIVTGFILSAASIVIGAGFLELMTKGFASGLGMMHTDSFLQRYPTVQFCGVVSGFVCSSLAALLAFEGARPS
jgi:hypothetical protein